MALDRNTTIKTVQSLVPIATNPDIVPNAALASAFDVAVLWHGRHVPRQALELGTGDGANCYFSLPSDYQTLDQVESVYGGTPPAYLAATTWEVHFGTAGHELVFETAPGSGDVFGMHYTGKWTEATLNPLDEKPIAFLTAALLCMRQASSMAQNVSTMFEADIINFGSLARVWISLKDQWVSLYAQAVGVSAAAVQEGAPPPAWGMGTVASTDRYVRFWWETD